MLYTQGLITEQIGEVFEQLYVHHYSKQSISRLAQTAHQEVLDWLGRPLDPYYPMVYIDLVISDGLVGIEDAVASHCPGVSHQLCLLHLKRRLDKLVKQADRGKLQQDLGQVFQMDQPEDTPEAGYQRWEDFLKVWGQQYRSIGAMRGKIRYSLYFTYLSYAPSIRRMVSTMNWVERLNRDYRCVLRMRGALPVKCPYWYS